MTKLTNQDPFWLVVPVQVSATNRSFCVAAVLLGASAQTELAHMIDVLQSIDGMQQMNFTVEDTPNSVVQSGAIESSSIAKFVIEKKDDSLSIGFDKFPTSDPIGLSTLRAALEQRRHSVAVIDSFSNPPVGEDYAAIWLGKKILYVDQANSWTVSDAIEHIDLCTGAEYEAIINERNQPFIMVFNWVKQAFKILSLKNASNSPM